MLKLFHKFYESVYRVRYSLSGRVPDLMCSRWYSCTAKREVETSTTILIDKERVPESSVDIHGTVPVLMKRTVVADIHLDMHDIVGAVVRAILDHKNDHGELKNRHAEARKMRRGYTS